MTNTTLTIVSDSEPDVHPRLAAARAYLQRGLQPVPIPEGLKYPTHDGWLDRRYTEQELSSHFNGDGNIGLLLDEPSNNLSDADLDSREARELAPAFLPATGMISGRRGSPRSHWLYRTDRPPRTVSFKDPAHTINDEHGDVLVELRAGKRQTLVPPSTHPSGEQVVWYIDTGPSVIECDLLERSVAKLAAGSLLARNWGAGARNEMAMCLAGALARHGWSEDEAAAFIGEVARVGGDDDPDHRLGVVQATFEKCRQGQALTGIPTLCKHLGKPVVDAICAWIGIGDHVDPPAFWTPSVNLEPDTASLLAGKPMTDAGNAECLALLHGDRLRYDRSKKVWLRWDGARWAADQLGYAERAALDTVRARQAAYVAALTNPQMKGPLIRWAIECENLYRRTALLTTATATEPFAMTVDGFDTQTMLAAAPNGTLDLGQGLHRPATRDDYLTMCLSATYDPSATCARWRQYVLEVCNGDEELARYVQTAVGYTLTGSVKEQVFFLLIGDGANGKSLFLRILMALFGEYGANTPFTTFDSDRGSGATNDIAALRGKRLVTIVERSEDRRLDEARIKAATGGDPVTCRFLYGEFFTYWPQFKIWMAMNHKPYISGTDKGIWRRVKIIPFSACFEGENDDKDLEHTLKAELPGTLNWALQGLARWRQDGLGATPKVMDDALTQYQSEMDTVGRWLEDRCIEKKDGETVTSEAIHSMRGWCKDHGYREVSDTFLGRALQRKGFERAKDTKGRRCYRGFELRPFAFSG